MRIWYVGRYIHLLKFDRIHQIAIPMIIFCYQVGNIVPTYLYYEPYNKPSDYE